QGVGVHRGIGGRRPIGGCRGVRSRRDRRIKGFGGSAMNTLYHQLFHALDELPQQLLGDREHVRSLLEMEVDEAGGYVSSQVGDFIEMLLDEYCMAQSHAA